MASGIWHLKKRTASWTSKRKVASLPWRSIFGSFGYWMFLVKASKEKERGEAAPSCSANLFVQGSAFFRKTKWAGGVVVSKASGDNISLQTLLFHTLYLWHLGTTKNTKLCARSHIFKLDSRKYNKPNQTKAHLVYQPTEQQKPTKPNQTALLACISPKMQPCTIKPRLPDQYSPISTGGKPWKPALINKPQAC